MLINPGIATRMCYENGTWGDPDVLSCQSLEIVRVSQEVYILIHTLVVENMQYNTLTVTLLMFLCISRQVYFFQMLMLK